MTQQAAGSPAGAMSRRAQLALVLAAGVALFPMMIGKIIELIVKAINPDDGVCRKLCVTALA